MLFSDKQMLPSYFWLRCSIFWGSPLTTFLHGISKKMGKSLNFVSCYFLKNHWNCFIQPFFYAQCQSKSKCYIICFHLNIFSSNGKLIEHLGKDTKARKKNKFVGLFFNSATFVLIRLNFSSSLLIIFYY